MSKICVNKSVFWTTHETKLSGKVKLVMSDHVVVVTPDGTQHLVSKRILDTKPMDKLALMFYEGLVKNAAQEYSEEELQGFLVGLNIKIILGESAEVQVDAIDAPGAPSDQHSKLLGDALSAVNGGQGAIYITDEALDRKETADKSKHKVAPISVTPVGPSGIAAPPGPPAPPPPEKEKKIMPPSTIGPMGG